MTRPPAPIERLAVMVGAMVATRLALWAANRRRPKPWVETDLAPIMADHDEAMKRYINDHYRWTYGAGNPEAN